MDQDREEQQHRLRNRKKSNSAKQAWKKHRYNYMRGIRQRERDNMKTSRDIKDESLSIKKLNEKLDKLLSEPINEISDTLANTALEKRQQQLNQAASKFSRMQNAINKRNKRKEGKVKEKLYLDLAFELKLSKKAIETLREHGCIEYKEDDDYVVLPKGTPITIDGDYILVFGIKLPANNIRNNDREVVNIEDEIKEINSNENMITAEQIFKELEVELKPFAGGYYASADLYKEDMDESLRYFWSLRDYVMNMENENLRSFLDSDENHNDDEIRDYLNDNLFIDKEINNCTIQLYFDDYNCAVFFNGYIPQKLTITEATEFKDAIKEILTNFKKKCPQVAKEVLQKFGKSNTEDEKIWDSFVEKNNGLNRTRDRHRRDGILTGDFKTYLLKKNPGKEITLRIILYKTDTNLYRCNYRYVNENKQASMDTVLTKNKTLKECLDIIQKQLDKRNSLSKGVAYGL